MPKLHVGMPSRERCAEENGHIGHVSIIRVDVLAIGGYVWRVLSRAWQVGSVGGMEVVGVPENHLKEDRWVRPII